MTDHTGEDGTFWLGWVPGGAWSVRVTPGNYLLDSHSFVRLPADVRGRDTDLRVEIDRSPPLPIRFTNLPPEWRETLPLVLWWYDPSGNLLSLPPTNAIGWPSGHSSTPLDREGRPRNRVPVPPPGIYTIRLVDDQIRSRDFGPHWFEQTITIDEGVPGELVVRVPDGARVTVITQEEHERLAIGPVIAWSGSETEHRFARVPAGKHEIWSHDRFSATRIGEVSVPIGGEIRCELAPIGSATLTGISSEEFRLCDASTGVPVAIWYPDAKFRFRNLRAGRYVLVTRARRVPVDLVDGQVLDLGDIG
ncbi:MAG: hypothetical protein ACYTGZ_14420 [Planctomycetota bacterium]